MGPRSADLEALARIPLFASLDPANLERIVARTRRVRFDDGEQAVIAGDPGDTAYVILTGSAVVDAHGRQLAELASGDVFGELALLDGGRRTATVTAIEPLECLALARYDLWTILHESPSIMEDILVSTASRLRAAMEPIDTLTGLPNRSMFEELLDAALGRAALRGLPVAVLWINIDGFAEVNESLGHRVGDELLARFAGRLRDAAPAADIVARAGDDDFLVLVADRPGDDANTSAALMAAENLIFNLHEALARPFDGAGQEVLLTASVGISIYPGAAEGPHTMLRDAAHAMRHGRERGPASEEVWSPHGGGSDRLTLMTRLRRAVQLEQWILHYQPLVDLTSGEIVGVEALVRWLDPDDGLVPPGMFIPLAEEIGLIPAIDEWVRNEAGRQSRAWRDEGLDLKIGFNLSPAEMVRGVADHILSLIEEHGIPPEKLVAEITESSAFSDPDLTASVLDALDAGGVTIAIDDFGTGFSSLSRLRTLPVSTLKIDRSFVEALPDDAGACTVARTIVRLADSLGMTTLAEGIEEREQWNFLLDEGCALGQGFLFSKPVPADEILARYREGRMTLPDPA